MSVCLQPPISCIGFPLWILFQPSISSSSNALVSVGFVLSRSSERERSNLSLIVSSGTLVLFFSRSYRENDHVEHQKQETIAGGYDERSRGCVETQFFSMLLLELRRFFFKLRSLVLFGH